MNNAQIKMTQEMLCEWLTEREEMEGKAPAKLEFAFAIRDERTNLIFFVFKFKKTARGKWLIGVGGGFPDEESTDCMAVFSGFDEFPEDEEEAVELAFKMASYILYINERQNTPSAFELNLEYIRNTELDVDKIRGQFVKTNSRFFLTVGTVDVPSGRVVVADPLCYMSGDHVIAPVLEQEIPAGSYPAEVAICRNEYVGIRMCTARLKIRETAAARYELATPVPETAAFKAKDGSMSGFPVDAGMMCFIDAEGAKTYEQFILNWHKQNPGGNHYDDYFAVFLAKSAQELPQYQSGDGDFMEWTNPVNGERMVQIASGMGDGFYQCFWGYDESGEICELVVPMVDPDIFED
ncbi:MAG: DUF4241 domain-containing protein [Acetatifactor muris]|nr:DUF4241 domain-containing protein [Acetatifactor muris]MCM1526615.1 DUF4241 domain-containing protein [Bacteroides sp.]